MGQESTVAIESTTQIQREEMVSQEWRWFINFAGMVIFASLTSYRIYQRDYPAMTLMAFFALYFLLKAVLWGSKF